MDPTTVRKITFIMTTIWFIFLLPVVLMIILVSAGAATFAVNDSVTMSILYYNILMYPLVLIISIAGSWLCLRYKKYNAAFFFALLPLANVFVEILAADIALFLN